MSKPTYDSVLRTSDKLQRQYRVDYAGKPRHTRPLEPIERLIAKSRALAKKASRLAGPRGREIEKTVRERLALYEQERDAIAKARFEDPSVGELHRLSLQINRAVARYRRHFAGRDRLVVDLALLDAILADLAAARAPLEALLEGARSLELTGTLNLVETQLAVLGDERAQILQARREADPERLAAALVARLDRELDRVRVHFAGHHRLTCEPERLRAIATRLDALAAELAASPHADAHADARATAVEQLPGLRAEVDAIAATHAAARPRERAHALGAAANHIFGLYAEHFAGQNRATRNLRLLGDLCERLDAILGQMLALDPDDPINAKNVGVVEDRLAAYEREWVEVAKARDAARPAGADPLAGLLRAGDD